MLFYLYLRRLQSQEHHDISVLAIATSCPEIVLGASRSTDYTNQPPRGCHRSAYLHQAAYEDYLYLHCRNHEELTAEASITDEPVTAEELHTDEVEGFTTEELLTDESYR